MHLWRAWEMPDWVDMEDDLQQLDFFDAVMSVLL